MPFHVYILFSEKLNRFYIGSTGNLPDRFKRHNQSRSKATKPGVPLKIVYTEQFNSKPEAYRRELYIKKQKDRNFILALIAANP